MIEQRSPAAYIAEFLGTFVLVFAITLSVTLFVNSQGTGSDWVVVGLVHFLVLFVLVMTIGSISGAHLNPAVTLSLAVLRKIRPNDAVVYILLQLAGAVAGALLTKYLLIDQLADQQNVGAPALNHSLLGTTAAGLVAEGIGTFVLVWTIVAVAVNPRATRDWAGLAIGGALGLQVMIIGPLTGRQRQPRALVRPGAGGHAVGRLLALHRRPPRRRRAGRGALLVPLRGGAGGPRGRARGGAEGSAPGRQPPAIARAAQLSCGWSRHRARARSIAA